MVEIRRIQIIEKQPANAALFVAMLEEEVVIAPLLVTGINVFAERLAQISRRAVPVNRILIKAVVGR